MSKIIDKIKEAFKNLSLFDEGNDIEAPDTIKEMAVTLSMDTGNSQIPNTVMSVDEIEKVLNNAINESEKIYARTFDITTRREKNINYTQRNKNTEQRQTIQIKDQKSINKDEQDREIEL